MAFGSGLLVTDAEREQRAIVRWSTASFPTHRGLRPSNKQEIKATSFIAMEIEGGVGEVRSKGAPTTTRITSCRSMRAHPGAHRARRGPSRVRRLIDGVKRPATLAGYSEGRLLEMHCGMPFCGIPGRLRSGYGGVRLLTSRLELPDDCRTQQRTLLPLTKGSMRSLRPTGFVAIPRKTAARGTVPGHDRRFLPARLRVDDWHINVTI